MCGNLNLLCIHLWDDHQHYCIEAETGLKKPFAPWCSIGINCIYNECVSFLISSKSLPSINFGICVNLGCDNTNGMSPGANPNITFISKTKVVRERGGILIWDVTSAGVSNPQKRSVQYCSCRFEHGQKAKKKKRSLFLQLFPKKVIKRAPSLLLIALREYKENWSVKGCWRECWSRHKFEGSSEKQRQQGESWELRFSYYYIRTCSKYIMHITLLFFGYVQVQNQSNIWYTVSWYHLPLEVLRLFFRLLPSISFLSLFPSCSSTAAFCFYQSYQEKTRRKL